MYSFTISVLVVYVTALVTRRVEVIYALLYYSTARAAQGWFGVTDNIKREGWIHQNIRCPCTKSILI